MFRLLLLLAALLTTTPPLLAGHFETLGTPVKSVMVATTCSGVDEHGDAVFYFSCSQPGGKLLLVQYNPRTKATHQWPAPVGEGAWAMVESPDHCIYLGTWESGYLLKFDPTHATNGIQSLGKPSASETYIWQLAVGADGRLYGCTYPQAKLVRYDPKENKSEDLGRLDPSEMYARMIHTGTNGLTYISIGTVHGQIIAFDPVGGERHGMFPDDQRPPGTPNVYLASDGRVVASAGSQAYECVGKTLKKINALPSAPATSLPDGLTLLKATVARGNIDCEFRDRAGTITKHEVRIDAAPVALFVVGSGPGGRIFGSTALPLEMFDYAPAKGEFRDLGNPTDVGGEIYSFTTSSNLLYLCAYPRSYLSAYDPTLPWDYGHSPTNNPRGIGFMGDGHLRPRDMLTGPDGRIYVGSLAPYGQVGGALGIFDPKSNSVTENYRHIVTNQGISSLTFETKTKRLFLGTATEAGGGARAVARECVVMAWDPETRKPLWQQVIVPGDTSISALATAHGRVFGVSRPSGTLFVIDPSDFKILSKSKLAAGNLLDISLGYYAPHDRLYGLTAHSIIAIDPETFAVTEVARAPERINCGFALTDTGLYFGCGPRLIRWRWD